MGVGCERGRLCAGAVPSGSERSAAAAGRAAGAAAAPRRAPRPRSRAACNTRTYSAVATSPLQPLIQALGMLPLCSIL